MDLGDKLKRAALRQALMRQCGVSQGLASDFANSKKFPSLERAVEIEAAIGLPPNAWVSKDAHVQFWNLITKDNGNGTP